MSKNPKFKNSVITSKNPKINFNQSAKQNFSWSFSKLDEDGPWGWSNYKEDLLYILKKKKDFELLTINKLYENGSHFVDITLLCKDAKDRLLNLKMEEIDSLFSFRLNGTHRIWCLKEENIMRVLWWDPKHQVCPSAKKHT